LLASSCGCGLATARADTGCTTRPAIDLLLSRPVRSTGYSVQIETLTRCQRSGLRITEVPIVFVDRVHGTSKLSQREIVQALLTVLRLTVAR